VRSSLPHDGPCLVLASQVNVSVRGVCGACGTDMSLPMLHPGSVSIAGGVAVDEDGTVNVTLKRAGGHDGSITVAVGWSSGSAIIGRDLVPPAVSTVSWGNSDHSVQGLQLRVIPNPNTTSNSTAQAYVTVVERGAWARADCAGVPASFSSALRCVVLCCAALLSANASTNITVLPFAGAIHWCSNNSDRDAARACVYGAATPHTVQVRQGLYSSRRYSLYLCRCINNTAVPLQWRVDVGSGECGQRLALLDASGDATTWLRGSLGVGQHVVAVQYTLKSAPPAEEDTHVCLSARTLSSAGEPVNVTGPANVRVTFMPRVRFLFLLLRIEHFMLVAVVPVAVLLWIAVKVQQRCCRQPQHLQECDVDGGAAEGAEASYVSLPDTGGLHSMWTSVSLSTLQSGDSRASRLKSCSQLTCCGAQKLVFVFRFALDVLFFWFLWVNNVRRLAWVLAGVLVAQALFGSLFAYHMLRTVRAYEGARRGRHGDRFREWWRRRGGLVGGGITLLSAINLSFVNILVSKTRCPP
jgi:hypothetical protein